MHTVALLTYDNLAGNSTFWSSSLSCSICYNWPVLPKARGWYDTEFGFVFCAVLVLSVFGKVTSWYWNQLLSLNLRLFSVQTILCLSLQTCNLGCQIWHLGSIFERAKKLKIFDFTSVKWLTKSYVLIYVTLEIAFAIKGQLKTTLWLLRGCVHF